RYLVIDLSHVHFFGASFVGTLVTAWSRLRNRQRHLAICGLTPFCAGLIQVLHLDKLFDIYPTQEMVLEKITQSVVNEGQELIPRQNRLAMSEVDWNKNLGSDTKGEAGALMSSRTFHSRLQTFK